MKSANTRAIILNVVILGLAFAATQFADVGDRVPSEARRRPLFAPPETIKHFTFGYGETMADSLWIRVIQDLDYCERAPDLNESRKAEELEWGRLSPEEQHRRNLPPALSGASIDKSKPSMCDRGWVYNYINAITELAPRFRMPYSAGATVMSILVDDREGARLIYEKGLQQFPDDWTMAYRAAYHYLYEVDDPRRAAELLVAAGKKGAPPWVNLLASRLYTVSGRAHLAKSVLEETLANTPPGPARERILQRLKDIDVALRASASASEGSAPTSAGK